MAEKKPRVLSLDPTHFELNEKGEVVIRDQAIASQLEQAKALKAENSGEHGITITIT
jgi:hypothetical protein